MLALVVGAAVGVVILVPTVVLLFPALGMAMGGAAALFAVCSAWPRCRWSTCCSRRPAGSAASTPCTRSGRGALPGLAALVAAVVLVGSAFAVDRFDAGTRFPPS